MKLLFKEKEIKLIANNKGNILKLLKNKNKKINFDEIYISEIKPLKTKAWKFHNKKVQRIYIPKGKVKVGIFDPKTKKIKIIILGEKSKKLLTIYNGVFYGFKSFSKQKSLILNLTYYSKKNKYKPINQPSSTDTIR